MKLIFPAAVLEQHIVATGKPGSGKSSVIRYVVEEVLEAHAFPVCIVDPKGDWWGLKFSHSGKGPGYPVVIFGGPHADIPIAASAGAAVGEIVSSSAFACIVDVSEFTMGERTRFFVDFAATLFRKTKGKRILVIDEVHNFVPQGKVMDPLSGQMLHWGNRLATEGRSKGLTIIAASQRPQKVHKDFLTSCETLIALRMIHRLDRKAIADWLEGAPDQDAAKQVLSDLANLKRGIGWMWSPEIGFGPKLIDFPRFRTYDSFKPQAIDTQLKGAADADELAGLREQFTTFIKEAEANDPRMLKKRIADLEEQIERRQEPAEDMVPESRLLEVREQYREEGYELGLKAAWSEVLKRVTSIMPVLNSLENARHQLVDRLDQSIRVEVCELAEALTAMETVAKAPPESTTMDFSKEGERRAAALRQSARVPAAQREKIAADVMNQAFGAAKPKREGAAYTGNGHETRVTDVRERKLLIVLAQHQGKPLSKRQINALAGYRESGKVSSAYGALARNGWMYETATTGHFEITREGLNVLGEYEPLPTGRRLLKELLEGSRLDVREKAILRVLAEHGGRAVQKGAILEVAGYQSSGKVSSAFSRLQKLGYARPAGIGALAMSKELL